MCDNRKHIVANHALLTGVAGFIGSHVAERLLSEGWYVTGVDNFDPFYPRAVKATNMAGFRDHPSYRFIEGDVNEFAAFEERIEPVPDVIVHLAAKAGVRPSIENATAYEYANVRGTLVLLEYAARRRVRQFVFASSSSVYGVNPNVPWSEDDHVLEPISPYAASKVAGELLGHVYSHLYGLRFIGLRFFTVYGPRQRPDLAIHKFARRILNGDAIPVYGDGTTERDYTYIDDIVGGLRAAIDYEKSPYEIINLGNSNPVNLMTLIQALEVALGKKATMDFLPLQPGDVPRTFASVSKAAELLGYTVTTPLRSGLAKFARWLADGGASGRSCIRADE